MVMEIVVKIKTCRNCRHLDHSGSFTVRGARSICGHSDSCVTRKTKEDFGAEYPEYVDRDKIDYNDWSYHWYHRIVDPENIPIWCPLKSGSKY